MPSLSSDNQVGILIKADADLKAVDDTTKSLGKLDDQSDKSAKRAEVLGAVGKAAAVGIAAAGVATVAFGASSAKAYMESQNAVAQLEAVIKSTGGAAGLSSEALQKQATALQAVTKFSDEAVMSTQSMLLTFTNIKGGVMQDATKTALDMAQALGMDGSQAAMQLGKALNDPSEGLSKLTRVGVTFSAEQEKQVKAMQEAGNVAGAQGIILQELQKEFGGSAEAAGGTFSGKLEILKNKFGDVQEVVGKMIIERLMPLAEKLTAIAADPRFQQFLEKATTAVISFFMILGRVIGIMAQLAMWLNQHRIVLAIVAGVVGALLVAAFVSWAIAATTAAIATLAAIWPILAIGAAVGAIAYLIITHWDTIKNAFKAGIDWIKNNWQLLLGILTGPIGMAVMLIIRNRDQIVEAFRNVASWIGGMLGGVYNAITSPFSRAWDFISGVPGRIVNSIGNIGNLLRDKIGNWDIPGPLGKVKDVIPGFASGGYTGAGGVNEVAGIVHKGEYVIPQSGVDQRTGLPKGGVTNNRQVSIGTIVLGDASAVREMFTQIDRDTMLTGMGLTARRGAF